MSAIVIKRHAEPAGWSYLCPVCGGRTGALKMEGPAKAREAIHCHISKSHYAWWIEHRRRVRIE